MVSPTHVLPCTAVKGREVTPSSENSFFAEAKGMPQISFAEHGDLGRKRASNFSKLRQVKKSKQDGYSPFLSHPSQALRPLQLSPCVKQLAL